MPALEAWLARALHERWDRVTTEPLSQELEELLTLLEAAC